MYLYGIYLMISHKTKDIKTVKYVEIVRLTINARKHDVCQYALNKIWISKVALLMRNIVVNFLMLDNLKFFTMKIFLIR